VTDQSGPLRAGGQLQRQVDFDLHGLVGIRLLDPTPADVAAVARQLGPLPRELDRPPDITIRFVPRLPTSTTLTHVGLGDTAFDGDAFYLVRSRNNTHARVRVPFESVGGVCELVAENGLPAVPLLLAFVNLTALAKGTLPLHASTVLHRGRGVLATGWSKGGKTETILALMREGARYVADEWSYVSADGRQVSGVPEPVRLWNWQLRQLPEQRVRLLDARQRARLDVLETTGQLLRRVARTGWGSGSGPLPGILRRAEPIISRQAYAQLEPHAVFGGVVGPTSVPLDVVLLVLSHDSDEVVLEPGEPAQVAGRMRHSLEHERLPLTSCYQQFRYAFPERSSAALESAGRLDAELLESALAGKPTYVLRHPYPVELGRLAHALEPLFS
jgi:hypothetical protein